uniref:Uncharacterized protein n=1 Tax=Oryza nivara TaxID=4536 RepID=A0A0E0HW61_ORYNI
MDDISDLVAQAIRLGKEEFLTCCSFSSSSWTCCLHLRSVSSHSSVARFSFFCQRSNGSLVICHLLDVSSASSNLICAISSLSISSASASPLNRTAVTKIKLVARGEETEPYLDLARRGRREEAAAFFPLRIAGSPHKHACMVAAHSGSNSGIGSRKETPLRHRLAPPIH